MYGDQSGEFVCGYSGLNKVDKYHGWMDSKKGFASGVFILSCRFFTDNIPNTVPTATS